MRVEFRNSGGGICQECGSTELLSVASTGASLETDLWDLIADGLGEWESEILTLCLESKMENDRIARHEIEKTKMKMASEHMSYEQAVEELFGREAPRYRLFKRRWQKRMREDFKNRTDELRRKTAEL